MRHAARIPLIAPGTGGKAREWHLPTGKRAMSRPDAIPARCRVRNDHAGGFAAIAPGHPAPGHGTMNGRCGGR
ncbi:hypothetical protein Skr01_11710 [Sphaerisporangium krabiense]|nr:hypothetical protein Skr01_11710 [Sphaerisporangium krabiense]